MNFNNLKNSPPEKVSMWLNIVSFVFSILFYLRVLFTTSHSTPVVINHIPEADSVLVIDTHLQDEIRELKQTQLSLIQELQQQKTQLKVQQGKVQGIRLQEQNTIHHEWDSLSPQDQQTYINQVLSNLLKQSSP